ncbi:MAG: hypothetical protein H0W73_13640 [Bacteroidetes bacterium]|nr:hypothetical protein [Bacteroidota bacterium]
MNRSFNLFGEKSFSDYALERFKNIARAINKMSDVEVLMYESNFDELIKKIVDDYYLSKIDVSFDDKLVDVVGKQFANHTRFFVEYTLIINGDPQLLTIDPYRNFIQKFLFVEVKTNVLIFEIDTNYFSDELNATVMQTVRYEYNEIKKFICDALLHLNNESQKFNLQLEDFIIPILVSKLRKAHYNSHIREKLNFK